MSLAFHLALYTLADWAGLRAPAPPPPRSVIEALLILPEIVAPQAPALQLAEAPPPEVPAVVPPAPAPRPPIVPIVPVVPQATLSRRPPSMTTPRFYPREAVMRGIEGEALVNVTLDASGKVLEARIERSSGHAILDDAALSAALSLKSLPGGGREVMLPVRFKLK
ncbi:MAG: energy transducer TonB [Sulfurisoma sp.]|nr:energy transducer TonB [Sulfurisoma sp.]